MPFDGERFAVEKCCMNKRPFCLTPYGKCDDAGDVAEKGKLVSIRGGEGQGRGQRVHEK